MEEEGAGRRPSGAGGSGACFNVYLVSLAVTRERSTVGPRGSWESDQVRMELGERLLPGPAGGGDGGREGKSPACSLGARGSDGAAGPWAARRQAGAVVRMY